MTVKRLETGPRMSQAVIHHGTVYLAGQVGEGVGVAEQTRDILAQIDSLLARTGSDKSRLLSAQIWLADISTFAEMNAVWEAWVDPDNTPARATVEAKLAAPKYLVEIMVVAAVAGVTAMLVLDERQTHNALPMTALIEALRAMFVSGCEMPVRHHHTLGVPGEPDATLLLMPAWQTGQFIGVKIATVFPGNSARGKAAVNAAYVLISAASGEVLAMVDGGELTARRTAAASALAADYLARKDAGHLLVVGTGRLSLNLIEAHAAVRPIRWVTIWGRSPEKAAAVAEKAAAAGFETEATDDLASAVGHADIVSCATLSNEALVHGAWLKPGAHLDLVGAFTPRMRESDDEAMRRASVFVDTRAGATREGGDIVLAMQSGALAQSDIRAELAELTRGEHKGRTSDDEITAFKSVGAALEDLAGAVLAYETAT